ncbi:MAG: hypothetical protein H8D97_00695 [Proteobacteria bacterium]|nr:hypothetical protein [Pseudomonadota bacterium]
MALKQLITTTKVSLVDYKASYTETNNLMVLSGKSIITNPQLINSGKMILDKNPKFQLVRAYSSSYIELASEQPMYIKIIIDSDFDATNEEGLLAQFTLKTSRFSYNNKEQPIIVAIGNGTMSVNQADGSLEVTPDTKDMTVEFVFGAHDLSYVDSDFSAFSNIIGGEF